MRKNVVLLLNGASHLVVMDTGKAEIPGAFFASDFTTKFSQAFVSLRSQSWSEPSWQRLTTLTAFSDKMTGFVGDSRADCAIHLDSSKALGSVFLY